MKTNRREALLSMSALALTGCGGGAQDNGSGATASATETAKEVAGGGGWGRSAEQFRLWDGDRSGPSREFWNFHLMVPWKNINVGDWLDADGVKQGGKPWAEFLVEAALTVKVDITALVRRWVSTGENRGAFLRGSGRMSSNYVVWAGRTSATPPRLEIETEEGEILTFPGLVTVVNPGTALPVKCSSQATHNTRVPALVQFKLDGYQGTVKRAHMYLTGTSRLLPDSGVYNASYAYTVKVFEVDPPRFLIGGDAPKEARRMGLAARFGGDAALRGHPSVLRVSDFANFTNREVFQEISLDSRNPYELRPDPNVPGTTMFRGSLTPFANQSISVVAHLRRADSTQLLRPAPPPVYNELYARLYFYLEGNWDSPVDVNKLALGWDMRMGWWNDYAGGYWYSITGNGGRKATGKKVFFPARSAGQVQLFDRWGYEGNSIRLVAGKDPGDDGPYSDLRPVQDYIYHLKQNGDFGDCPRLGNMSLPPVLSKRRWHCIEQRIKMNTVDTSNPDALGNGKPNEDGHLETWLDGVLIDKREDYAWRAHPDIGICGPWINWYFGGRTLPKSTMNYCMNHLVVATEYIGPLSDENFPPMPDLPPLG